ncbi:Ribosome maturation factor RimP [Chryseobacterium salivictor]|uniref:Ribosome maturation factor RimP n=2 Tax=Chryseobacterium salivictor TaxID=2547600 RepID=A0A4P6ZD82_9FLAO|nr:Ribosome maturation factor RimP [Chryseobacterium salivictor]
MQKIYGNYNEKAFGRKPFFVRVFEKDMEFKAQIEQLLNDFLAEREDLFLIDIKFSVTDHIRVILDGDHGVTLQDCLDASRAIEFNMDRDEHDFSMEVMSAGLSEPLNMPRQYRKNIGRSLELVMNDSSEIEGELTKVEEDKITLVLKYRKPKEIGKGKVDVVEEKEIPYSDIKKALVAIKF